MTDDEWLANELGNLKNEDFLPEKEIQYSKRSDYHPIEDLVNDALSDESLAKVDLGDLKNINDPLTKMVALCYEGQAGAAKQVADKLYGKYKKNPAYWNQVGTCFYLQRNIKKAKIFYRRAYKLDAKYVPAINNLGVVYMLEGKERKAQVAFEQALVVNRTAKTPKFNLVNLYVKYGLFTKAKAYINHLLKSGNRFDKDVLLAKAYVHIYENNPSEALVTLGKVEKKYLENKRFAMALYFTYKKLNDKRAQNIGDFLNGQNLSSQERATLNRIRQL